MIVTKLAVKQFRNLKEICIEPSPTMNIICGENGQGKTNLLEALWLFCASRSFTGAADSELIPFDSDFLRVEMEFRDSVRENAASYAMNAAKKKEAMLNGIAKSSMSIFSKRFFCVVFCPDDLLLVKGGPAERRRELDLVICQLKPQYNQLLANYNKIITQRNSLLKQIRAKQLSADLLTEYDAVLAKTGARISLTRKSYCERLCSAAADYYRSISADREQLGFAYRCWSDEITPERLLAEIIANRERDLATCQTSVGAHRDDLHILLDGRPAREFGSQGQQRSVVLSLKLAESVLIEQTTNEKPVILLDDVLSELDARRREYLLHSLSDRQIFLTGCDYNQLRDAERIFLLKDGQLTQQAVM